MSRRRFLGTGMVAGAAMLLSSCAAQDTAAVSGGTPRTGGTLIYFEPQTFTTLYPPQAGFYPNGGILNNIADRLLYQDPNTLQLHPWIAESLPETNADATVYTFRIRQGVTHSDGSRLDAANVVKNFDLFGLGDKTRKLTVSEQISNYQRGEVLDEYTARFHFTKPAPGFAQAVSTMNAGLLSNATLDLDANGFGPGQATRISASGPFVISGERVGTRLSVSARKDYAWAPPHLAQQGRAYLDGIEYVVNGEYSVRIGALVSGQADAVREVEAPDEERLKAQGLQILAGATNGVNNGLNLRFRHELLQDIRVRQAIIAAIDRKAAVEKLFTANYPLATGVLARRAEGYKNYSSAWVHSPSRAEALLDAAGWRRDSAQDGVRSKDGRRLSLRCNIALPQPRSREVMALVQQDLRRVGIDMVINQGDRAAQTLDAEDLGKIQLYHSMVGRADFDVLQSQYAGATRNALLNLDEASEKIADTRLETLLQKITTEPRATDRRRASHAAQDRLVEQAYVLPFFEEPQVFAHRRRVRGMSTEAVARPSFYGTWLETDEKGSA